VEENIPVPRNEHIQVFPQDKLSELITLAERPVVIAGTLALRKNLSSQLNQLAVPVFSVAAAKGVIDETLPQSAGVYTGVGLELTPEFSILPQADLVIGVGLRHNEILGVKPFQCRAINLDPLGEGLCSGFQFDHVLDGSPKEMEIVFTALARKDWGLEFLESCLGKMRDRLLTGQFMPAHAFQVIEQYFQHGARLVLDTGNFCTIGEHIWRVLEPKWYLSSGQGRYMGVGLPMALGAAVYDTSIPTVACLGDGGIGMFIAEIKMAVKRRLPLLVVLMSDSHLGSIRMRSIRDGLTEKPVVIHQPSWLKTVEGLGVNAAQAKNETEVEEILKSWNYSDGPLFMEIAFDPEGYQHMIRDIR
jgi:acetolactate synthase-1/2/3 large subunit